MSRSRLPLLRNAALCLGGVVVVLAVGEAGYNALRNRAPSPAERMKAMPQDILNPNLSTTTLEGARRDAYLRRKPDRAGDRGPTLETTDYRLKPVRIPALDGRPVVCVLSDGTIRSGGALHALLDLTRNHARQLHAIGIVSTSSEYLWGHHAGTFSFQPEIQLVHDPDGRYLDLVRPEGSDPEARPVVFVVDGRGRLLRVIQPQQEEDWVREIVRLLKLVPRQEETPRAID